LAQRTDGAKDISSAFYYHHLVGIFLASFWVLACCISSKATGFIKLKEEAYYMSEAAVKMFGGRFYLFVLLTFLVSLLILMIPTYVVKK
jgi:lipoprotein-releasing system permease protein